MKELNISLNNFDNLKSELILNWESLESYDCLRENNPYWIRIYELLDIKTNLSELEKAKEYLKKFDLVNFQIIVYLPYANTGFHIDGDVNRYLIPISSSKDALNFELDEAYLGKKDLVNTYFQDKIRWNLEPSKITTGFDWINLKAFNNKVFTIDEGMCIEIGKNWHAHINNHFNHRIILVFDTKSPIKND